MTITKLQDIKNKSITIIKRDGRKEPFSKSKLKKVCMWATDNNEILVEQLLRDTEIKLREEVKITSMYNNLIDTAVSKVSRLQPQWQFIAGKLYLLALYSEAYGIKDKMYPHLQEVLAKGVSASVYSRELLSTFTAEEVMELNDYIRPEEDYTFTYQALKQFNAKYCKNYSKTKKLELPQMTYMRVAMGLFYNKRENKLELIKKLYDILTSGQATMATPIMMNSFTPLNSFASCILNTIGNSTWDLMNKLTTAGMYTKGRGGVAFDISHIQAKGGLTKNGVQTGGIVPFIQNIQSVVNSMMQCYDGETQVLTTSGFKYFRELTTDDKVAQYTYKGQNEGDIEFVPYTNYVEFDYKGPAYAYTSKYNDLLVTPNHRMLRLTESGNPVVEFAEDCEYNNKSKIIVSGNKIGSLVHMTSMDRLAVAFQADGHIDKRYSNSSLNVWQFNFTKERKIDRLTSILSALDMEFKIAKYKHSTRINVYVSDIIANKYASKTFEWVDIENLSSNWASEFIDELGYWDGTKKSNGETLKYATTSKVNAEIVQMIAHLDSRRSTIGVDAKRKDKHNDVYYVGFNRTTTVSGGNKKRKTIVKSEVNYTGKFYCVSVPSSFLVVKRGGKISISGNSDTRRGSAVITCAWWHLEIEEFLQLKDASSGTEENRALHLQYSFATNDVFMRAVENNEDVYLFDPLDTPELLTTYGEEFEVLYNKAIARHGIRRKKVNARAVYQTYLKFRFQTGNMYEIMLDNVNKSNMTNRYIGSSNLCVTGDTKILTKDFGYIDIKKVAGHTLDCWNGKDWEQVPLFKTSDGQKVLKVTLSNGQTIEATPYHKWYVMPQNRNNRTPILKRTCELLPNDKLIKFDLEPITHGTKELKLAYVNGFHTGDGTVYKSNGRARISLHDGKQTLISRFSEYYNTSYTKEGRILNLMFKPDVLKDKFFIPDNKYSVASRIKWLEGYLDADGTLTNNKGTESIQVASIEKEFINNLLLMLQELGIHSKVSKVRDAGYTLLPANDGSGELKEYWTKEAYRLLIAGSEHHKLLALGYSASRVQPTVREYSRSCLQYTKVISVEDEGEYAATYCGTSEKEHKLMFNGVLIGNCSEVLEPSRPGELVEEKIMRDGKEEYMVTKFKNEEIALCNLASFNCNIYSLGRELYDEIVYIVSLALDNTIDIGRYMRVAGEHTNEKYRYIGLGFNNYANYMARQHVLLDTEDAEEETFKLFQGLTNSVLRANTRMAKDLGTYPMYRESKWAEGIVPYDIGNTHIKNKYEHLVDEEEYWEIKELMARYGRRNALSTAIAPTASSATSKDLTEAIEPILDYSYELRGAVNATVLVPEFSKLNQYYSLAYEVPQEKLVLLNAIRQLFIDQSQSFNMYIKEENWDYKYLAKLHILAWKLGVKTQYYLNTPKMDIKNVCDSCSS